MSDENSGAMEDGNKRLFWGCFLALIATAFGFIVRIMVLGEWQTEFNLTETQKGEILGVGFWPFAVSIILFSLIIDRIGYAKAMGFAFICHVLSTVLVLFAKGDNGYQIIWVSTLIAALGNGTVEAFINPVVATMFRKDKTKWLNILHAGWPGGMVLGGILVLLMGDVIWQVKVGLILVPTIGYGIMLFRQKFPDNERVESGVSYLAMLKEVGIIGALIVSILMTVEITSRIPIDVLHTLEARVVIVLLLTGVYGFVVKSFGKPLFVFLLLIMMPLAITELGTDGWITSLMENEMKAMELNPVLVLLYTSTIMMILRFSAGAIVHKISPIGLLAASSVIAILGLLFLSTASGVMILVAATLYAFGKTFFWPTMLGVVAEQFPKGGALTLNVIAGVGMLTVGILGSPLIGYLQDTTITATLEKQSPELHAKYTTADAEWAFGKLTAIDQEKLKGASEEDAKVISTISAAASKASFRKVALFPCSMLVCYIILIVYFRSKGGYKPVEIDSENLHTDEGVSEL